MEGKKESENGIANGRLRRRGRREMYWRAGGVSGGLDRHPIGLTAEFLPLVMFVKVEGGLLLEASCCLREVEAGQKGTVLFVLPGASLFRAAPGSQRRWLLRAGFEWLALLAMLAKPILIGVRTMGSIG